MGSDSGSPRNEERHSKLADYAARAGLSLSDILNHAADLLLGEQARRSG